MEEQNFSTLIEFINAMEVREDDEEYKNPVDLMFDALESEKPNHFAVRQYKKYKLAAGKTAKSILISCGARLAVFDIAELREVTAYDELELDTLGDKKTALFLIMSDTDDSFNFLISMCYTQLFNLLCEKADDVYGGRLPVHVRCLIDECANIGQIPKLEKLVATIRSREISACLVLQAQSQLKAIYKDNADTIIGNMDTSIFLGGKEPTTLKELAAALGKETIDTYNTGESRGRETSHSLNYQKLGKDMPYLFVKSWLPNIKINGTGTRLASNSANHVFSVSLQEMFLIILRPTEETHYNHLFLIGDFGVIYVPAFAHEGKVFFDCAAFELFVRFKVALHVLDNRGYRRGFCLPGMGLPQVFDNLAEVRLYDMPEKLVFVHITGVQLPMGKFVLTGVVIFHYFLSGEIHKGIKGVYLARSDAVDIDFNVRHVFLKGRVPDNLAQQTVVEMPVFEKLYGVIIKLQRR